MTIAFTFVRIHKDFAERQGRLHADHLNVHEPAGYGVRTGEILRHALVDRSGQPGAESIVLYVAGVTHADLDIVQ